MEFVYSFVKVLEVLTAHVGGTITGNIYYDRNLPLEMNVLVWWYMNCRNQWHRQNKNLSLKLSLLIDKIVLVHGILFTSKW